MAGILGTFRGISTQLFLTLLGICAYTFLNHPDFVSGANIVQEKLSFIGDPQVQNQMKVPLALSEILPIGFRGIFCAVMLFAWIAVDGSYLHSWGSIFIQDVVVPFRKKPFSTATHLSLLRWSMVGVALFAFCFSILYRQTDYILMFFAITGAIYCGGAGAAIIGGLYWKKGTTIAAWVAMIIGSGLSVGAILLKQLHPDFPVNGQYLAFGALLCAASSYVIISYLTCKKDFNMDQMLHRGKYAIEGERPPHTATLKNRFLGLIGIDPEFTRGDRWISGGVFAWTMSWLVVFVVVSCWNLIAPWSVAWWANFWHVAIILLPLAVGVVSTTWISIGGIRDLKNLFPALRAQAQNKSDDGMVVNHHNRGE